MLAAARCVLSVEQVSVTKFQKTVGVSNANTHRAFAVVVLAFKKAGIRSRRCRSGPVKPAAARCALSVELVSVTRPGKTIGVRSARSHLCTNCGIARTQYHVQVMPQWPSATCRCQTSARQQLRVVTSILANADGIGTPKKRARCSRQTAAAEPRPSVQTVPQAAVTGLNKDFRSAAAVERCRKEGEESKHHTSNLLMHFSSPNELTSGNTGTPLDHGRIRVAEGPQRS